MPQSHPVLIVLAAGRGSGFDAAALDALTLESTLNTAQASRLPVLVVSTRRFAPLLRGRQPPCDVIELGDAPAGLAPTLGEVIAAGVAGRPDARGWLVLPGDLAQVRATTLAAVAAALADHPVAYAQHRGRPGHPVGFAAELYSELVVLAGTDGARRLLARYPSYGVDVDDPGALPAPEVLADAAQWRSVHGGTSQPAPDLASPAGH
jgi:molybdenum cofactor cytidylyltransferase